ncbi:MAG: sulfoxide reductase heme-binding subunit YedZ [Methylomicrobium sp.]|nr:sulfoxide reductase heme-binding subunit YedZ [Methylomicrobium sp.]
MKVSTLTVKCMVFGVCVSPFMVMLWNAYNNTLGPNPVEAMTHFSGLWTLRFLLITLTLTPIKMIYPKSGIIKYRRMLGLFTFFYATLHFLIFLAFEHGFSVRYILEDILTSPIVDVGLLAYILLIPLALTSTNEMMRKLGKAWKKMHISVYVIGMLSILHFALSEKADITNPLFYASILLILLTIRGVVRNRTQKGPKKINDT